MKKLISTLTALTLTLSSMIALSSNAAVFIYDPDSDEYQDILNNYTLIDTDIAKNYFKNFKFDNFYSNETGTRLISTRQLSSNVIFALADGASENDVRDLVWEYCADNATDLSYTSKKRIVTGFIEPDYKYEILTYGQGSSSGPEYSVKVEDAKNLCKILKEKNLISGFKYVNRNQIKYFDAMNLDYPLTSHYVQKSDVEKYYSIQADIAKNFPDCEMIIEEDEYGNAFVQFIPPNENASVEEIMEFSIKLNETYGEYICSGGYTSPTSLGNSNGLGGSIDMYNAVLGDANCDGFVTIADSTLILQSLTNHDEYSLSEQGRYNADVIGDLDGVTAMDALEIQKLDAKVIDNFE